MSAEEKVAAAREWFADVSNAKEQPTGLAPYREPEPPLPYDMTTAAGTFAVSESLTQHRCRNCQRPIPVGTQHVAHRLWETSTVTNHYHESCVILP